MDSFFMKRAMDLAAMGEGWVSPNPMVGAVLVKDNQIIGEGYHKKAGGPHAEIFCLNEAKKLAKGATLYVTLEPCSHYGKTPPCTEAIIKAGVEKVVVAMEDPNPLVAGKGIEILKQKDIEVTLGVLEQEARALNEVFIKFITTRMPYVAVKVAATLDGKIATYNGSSKWITGKQSREYVHNLRHKYDAILVGINTVLKDNPSLNCRLEGKETRDPVRVLLDTHLKIPLDAKIINSAKSPLIIFTASENQQKVDRLNDKGVEVIKEKGDTKIDISFALNKLAEKNIASVLVEGGSEVLWSFFEQNLVDKFYKFMAPKIIGGKNSLFIIGGEGVADIGDAIKMKWEQIKMIGEDILIISSREM